MSRVDAHTSDRWESGQKQHSMDPDLTKTLGRCSSDRTDLRACRCSVSRFSRNPTTPTPDNARLYIYLLATFRCDVLTLQADQSPPRPPSTGLTPAEDHPTFLQVGGGLAHPTGISLDRVKPQWRASNPAAQTATPTTSHVGIGLGSGTSTATGQHASRQSGLTRKLDHV